VQSRDARCGGGRRCWGRDLEVAPVSLLDVARNIRENKFSFADFIVVSIVAMPPRLSTLPPRAPVQRQIERQSMPVSPPCAWQPMTRARCEMVNL